jgi:histidine triad (HIT) family protein
MADNCVFCAIVEGKIPSHKIYESEKVLAFLDIHLSAPGHILLIHKVHVARVEDLEREDAEALFKALHGLVGGIQRAMGAPASTIGINNGRESGQEVPHVHIHIIPRSRGDRGGIIQGLAHSSASSDQERMSCIAERIRASISDQRKDNEA